MKNFSLLFYCFIIGSSIHAQSGADSALPKQDSLTQAVVKKDTSKKNIILKKKDFIKPLPDTNTSSPSDSLNIFKADYTDLKKIKTFQEVLKNHPYYNFFGKSVVITMQPRTTADKDWLFYILVGLIFYFALINVFFGKYLNNLMALFFRVTMRQPQLREQVLQTPLPSLLLNIFFIVSGGLYLTFITQYYQWVIIDNFWLLWIYSILVLMIVYLCKFLILKIIGWVFGVKGATDTYIFIVFLVNKVIGIFLLPVLLVLAFPHPGVFQIVVTLSFSLIIILFIYRFFISYRPVRNEIKVNPFHFFLYLCAFEIAPLLLIYKVLLKLVESDN